MLKVFLCVPRHAVLIFKNYDYISYSLFAFIKIKHTFSIFVVLSIQTDLLRSHDLKNYVQHQYFTFKKTARKVRRGNVLNSLDHNLKPFRQLENLQYFI